jgi:hypothetical protein
VSPPPERAAERPPRIWPPFAAIAALLALQLYAFHWGVITPDTVFQYDQALTGAYDDWHPPITAWIWSRLLLIHRGSAPFLVLDALLYWTGVGAIAEAFRRRGERRAMWAVIACGALPIPFGQIGAILKDPLLAACCLAATGLMGLYRLTGRRLPPAVAIVCLTLFVVASATRFNAIFATVPLALCLLPARLVRTLPRAATAMIAIAALFTATTTLINLVGLHPTRSHPILSLVNFDLAGITAHGGSQAYPELSPAFARTMTARCYTPQLYNPKNDPQCGAVEDSVFAYSQASGRPVTSIWLDAIAAAPLPWLRHRISHLNWNWRFLVPTVPEDAVYVMSEPNGLGLHFQENPATGVVAAAAEAMAASPLGRPATWMALPLALLIVAPQLPSRRFITALSLSALLYGGAYAVVSVAPDMRYNLWTLLAATIAAIIAAAGLERGSGWRIWAALVPVTLAIGLELVWWIFALPAI